MDDLEKYVAERKKRSTEFDQNYDSGYLEFKISVLLREARKEAGLTQQELADIMQTKKTAISRMENHAKDIRLSTLQKFAESIGKKLELHFV